TSIQWYSQAVLAIGGKDVYDRGLDDPAFVQAAEVVKKMFDYTTSDAIGAGAAISAGHFLNERTAIFLNGPWFFGRLPKEGAPGLYENVGLAYGPTFTGGKGEKNGMAGKPQAYVALGNQTDPAKAQAAIDFVKFITDPTWVAKLSESSGALFFVKTQAGAGMERLQAELVEMNNKAPYVGPTFQVMPVAVLTEFPQALDGLVTGEMTPQQFVDTLKPLAK
ncbi:MAG: ABC transporter substrate-binding protein, partial [Oscillibacter sp.]